MKHSKQSRRGFTLLEVLLVVAILGMLAGVAVVTYSGVNKKAKRDTTQRLVDAISQALHVYNDNIGHYPTEQEGGLQALRTKPEFDEEKTGENWAGPYLTRDPVDAWGQALNYQVTEEGTEEAKTVPFKLWSNGPNEQDDNGAEDDIRNAEWAASEEAMG